MGKRPSRITRAEADALVAHLSPAERRRRIERFIADMASIGVTVREVFDAAGRSYMVVDVDQVRAVSPKLTALFRDIAEQSPLPQGHTPPAA